eukprot:3387749-Rhodomonas_salina.1
MSNYTKQTDLIFAKLPPAARLPFSRVPPRAVVPPTKSVYRDCAECGEEMREFISNSIEETCNLCGIDVYHCTVVRCKQCKRSECSNCEISKTTAERMAAEAELLKQARGNVGCV